MPRLTIPSREDCLAKSLPLLEVVAVALNLLTDYVNNVAQTDTDFPTVLTCAAA